MRHRQSSRPPDRHEGGDNQYICWHRREESDADYSPIAGTPLNGPRAIDFDRDGNLWLALREGNAVYKLDLKAGHDLSHRWCTGKQGNTGNGGPALAATLSGPKGLSVGPDGNVYLADTESHTIRMIDPVKETISLIAGDGTKGDGPDGDPLKCKMSRPHGIFVDTNGDIFIGDTESNRVRVIHKAGTAGLNPALHQDGPTQGRDLPSASGERWRELRSDQKLHIVSSDRR